MDDKRLTDYEKLVDSVYEASDDARIQMKIFEKIAELMELKAEEIASGSASHAERVGNQIVDAEMELNTLLGRQEVHISK